MNATQNKQLTDKERAEDALSSQKFLTGTYNTYVNEAATPELKNALLTILNEEHRIQTEVWNEMNARGWYTTEQAEDQKIQKERQKYSNFCEDCKIGG